MTSSIAAVCSTGLLLWISCLAGLAAADTLDRTALQQALESPEREFTDRIRDESRKPVEVLEFLGLEPGMHVLDVYAAGGYYTYILSRAVGLRGRVYAQNSPRSLQFEEDRSEVTQGDALANRIERAGLLNVVRVDRPVSDMGLEAESLDLILVSQILHDYYNRHPSRARNLLQQLHVLLKPGGVVGIIDHAGIAGQNNTRLHRMVREDAIAVAQRAGFIVEEESDLLANPQDNPRRSIFDPMLNRESSQFLLRLRKPLN